ncbi:protein ELC-like [Carica papaya]|uniref:protein ELC-like n=1 Tax=Carica papaya TaxID=3649 RepID=UPI000B8CD894|nr:protein ELC-like [Carica papaya]XP_021895446.1 protein ELC-like [Carica papaya]XP_021895447.1 protein ELC-like [Carica papaya]
MVTPNPQQIQQFLSSVLSQRGPSALPYAESSKYQIRKHLLDLIAVYPSLEPKTSTFTHNDGRTVNLLQADGTIPMPFQGVTYNIPIIIWLLDTYPIHPPCVYLNPTRDMIIKRPHPYVSPSGLVSIPYLQNWVPPSSNLLDLARNLSAAFSRNPPLYSQRRPQTPPAFTPSSSGYGSVEQSPSPARPPHALVQQPPRVFPPSPYGAGRIQQQQQQHHHHATDDAAEVYRRNAMNKIVNMAHGDLVAMRKAREAETEGLLSAQAALKTREEEINKGLKEMQDEKEGLEQQLQLVLMNTDVLEAWVKENEGKTKNFGDMSVEDNAFECMDTLSKQMLDCTAADLAIEDVVYSLDKAVQEGAVPFDQYLRNVRLLSREQFFHRATAAKVRAAQMQAQVAVMASRSHHYGS